MTREGDRERWTENNRLRKIERNQEREREKDSVKKTYIIGQRYTRQLIIGDKLPLSISNIFSSIIRLFMCHFPKLVSIF